MLLVQLHLEQALCELHLAKAAMQRTGPDRTCQIDHQAHHAGQAATNIEAPFTTPSAAAAAAGQRLISITAAAAAAAAGV